MIVDDHHGLIAVLAAEVRDARRAPPPPLYLGARIPGILHLRLVSALFKPAIGRLTQHIHAATFDPAQRSALVEAIAVPRSDALAALDDRPLAAAIGALTAERGVSIAFAAVIAHAQASGQPILIDPVNEAPWIDIATRRGLEVISRPARLGG